MSMPPASPCTRANAASTCASWRWSQRIAVIAPAASFDSAAVRPVMKTRAPAAASAVATPRPMPLVPPVTRAVRLTSVMPNSLARLLGMTLVRRTALVTGGTKGIGRGVATALAAAGARVFITGRTAAESNEAAGAITAIRCDHRQDAQVDAAFARVQGEAGGIDILVNNVWGGYDN